MGWFFGSKSREGLPRACRRRIAQCHRCRDRTDKCCGVAHSLRHLVGRIVLGQSTTSLVGDSAPSYLSLDEPPATVREKPFLAWRPRGSTDWLIRYRMSESAYRQPIKLEERVDQLARRSWS